MVKLVAFVVQLAVAILVTAAGLYFDYKALAGFGVALFALAIILGLSVVIGRKPSRPHERSVQNLASVPERPPPDLDDKQRAVWTLRRALNHAKDAVPFFSGIDRLVALNRLRASYGLVARLYNLPGFSVEAFGVRGVLKAFIGYVDSFLPLLEEGQVEAARDGAKTYLHWHSD